MEFFRDKKGIWKDYIGWLILGLAALIISLLAYFIMSGKASGGIEFAKNLIRGFFRS